MKRTYIEKNFSAPSLEVIETANEIIADYQAQGGILTLGRNEIDRRDR